MIGSVDIKGLGLGTLEKLRRDFKIFSLEDVREENIKEFFSSQIFLFSRLEKLS